MDWVSNLELEGSDGNSCYRKVSLMYVSREWLTKTLKCKGIHRWRGNFWKGNA